MFCTQCGSSLEETQAFCTQCGTATQQEVEATFTEESQATNSSNRKGAFNLKAKLLLKNKKVIAGATVGALVVVGGGYTYYRAEVLPQNLYNQSILLAKDGNYTEAIFKAEEAVELKGDSTYKLQLLTLQEEQEAIKIVNQFYKELESAASRVDSASSIWDLNRLCTNLSPYVKQINSLSLDGDSEIANFVKRLTENSMYILFTNDYVTGNALSDITTSIFNSELVMAPSKMLVGSIMDDVLGIKLPESLKNVK